jgi:large subunit ribosomal protein L15
MIRTARKLKKYLGTRTRGAGNTKNRRGAGSKGGKGRTGSKKHKFNQYVKLFGTTKHGCQSNGTIVKTITLNNINNFIATILANGKITSESLVNGYEIDFEKDEAFREYDKVLGSGTLDFKIKLKNIKCTKIALEKINSKGGLVE